MDVKKMYKTADMEGVPPVNPASAEHPCAVQVPRSQPYAPMGTGTDATSWTMPQADNSIYSSTHRPEPIAGEAQNNSGASSAASSSSLTTASVAHDYTNYPGYTSADAYAYGSAGYTGYYNTYQQQPSQPYTTQQQTSHLYSHPQPSNSHMQHQPNHFTPQQDPNHSYLQQQPIHQYTQPVGAYQNSGAPYQPISSFQNSGSYTGTTSYSTTYYNHGHYQTPGGYHSNGYNNQSAPWSDGSYVNYDVQQVSNISSSAASGHLSGAAPTSATINQQHYKQWEDYYNQTDVPCAPGTEHLSTSSSSNQGNYGSVYATTSSYQPPSHPQIRSAFNSFELTAQPAIESPAVHNNYWNHGATHPNVNSTGPQAHKSSETKSSYDTFQEQQMNVQIPNPHYSTAHQVIPQSHRVSQLQIPTNPKIAPYSSFSAPTKPEKDIPSASAVPKPAYVSVSLAAPSEKSHPTDSAVKPEAFPVSLRDYVNRAFKRCTDEAQQLASQAIMKEIITKATADGTLCTRDWDTEPLFPLPENHSENKEYSTFPITKRSPKRRSKSRWEPLSEMKISENTNTTTIAWDKRFVTSGSNHDEKSVKRKRVNNSLTANEITDPSSDSDKEQSLTAYHSSALALANNPAEKKRRESRSKRFEKGNTNETENNFVRSKNTKKITAVTNTGNIDGAVEDIDWDSHTVKGTSQVIEKRYLRLTSAPDPSSVRPEDVLVKALTVVQNSDKNYLYKCDQLKSIRQDLTVQHIRNHLTVQVYETHARLALENGDLPEYNQCQSQLKSLYAEGVEGCHMEFAAYNLLCVILHSNNRKDLLSAMSRLTTEAKNDEAVKHALSVRAAVSSDNYVMFFKLYKSAPNLNSRLLDLYVEKMRYKAVTCISRSYRPSVPVSYVAQTLGFSGESDGCPECVEWLKAHGAVVMESNGELLLDIKASASTLYMPEPDDAVAHGDANLAVNDFFTRSS